MGECFTLSFSFLSMSAQFGSDSDRVLPLEKCCYHALVFHHDLLIHVNNIIGCIIFYLIVYPLL